jgi:hypothetical protein
MFIHTFFILGITIDELHVTSIGKHKKMIPTGEEPAGNFY